MNATRALRLQAPAQRSHAVPLAERGRMFFVPDVVALLTRADGTPLRSEWWVRNSFAPDKKHKLGRQSFWWECDVSEAIAAL